MKKHHAAKKHMEMSKKHAEKSAHYAHMAHKAMGKIGADKEMVKSKKAARDYK